jgi:hypothetical protein
MTLSGPLALFLTDKMSQCSGWQNISRLPMCWDRVPWIKRRRRHELTESWRERILSGRSGLERGMSQGRNARPIKMNVRLSLLRQTESLPPCLSSVHLLPSLLPRQSRASPLVRWQSLSAGLTRWRTFLFIPSPPLAPQRLHDETFRF